MNRTVVPLLLFILLCLHITQCVESAESKLVKTMADGHVAMLPWNEQGDKIPDFSFCGYQNGGVKLPEVPTLVTLEPSGAEDESERIQTALDDLGKELAKTPGKRGALLLKKGLWKVNTTLTLSYHGWSGNTTVFWNCAAPMIFANQPPLGQNFMIGNSDPKLFDSKWAKGYVSAVNSASGRKDEFVESPFQGSAWQEYPTEMVTVSELMKECKK